MRELTNKKFSSGNYRRQLLTTVSATVLTIAAYGIGSAKAADSDADRPQIWIELGGQLSRQESSQEKFNAPFFAIISAVPTFDSPLKFESQPRYSIDDYGKLSFQPDGSDWVFSASIRYGKSSNKNHTQQTHRTTIIVSGFPYPPHTHTVLASFGKFSDVNWIDTEKHEVLDFQAGKDMGLGLFGGKSSSVIDVGVRFAQFSSRSKADINADPTIHYPTHPVRIFPSFAKYHEGQNVYWAHDYNERGFRGVGPSISWQGSTPIAGNLEDSQLQLDWGLNAAALFGRQTARGDHQYSSFHNNGKYKGVYHAAGAPTVVHPLVSHNRSRSVTVPNVGGSIGLSFQSGDAKVSFGYRADLFIGAMDTGIDAAKKSNMLFHGPYASISIGLGD